MKYKLSIQTFDPGSFFYNSTKKYDYLHQNKFMYTWAVS